MTYLLLKALHLIAVICWFAGLFYLPRLFVYHAMSEDEISRERFKIMERKLYRGIMTPSLVILIIAGTGMLLHAPGLFGQRWLQIKLALVALLVVYHVACGVFLKQFAADKNTRSHVFYRVFNEVPVLLLIVIVLLVVVKPF